MWTLSSKTGGTACAANPATPALVRLFFVRSTEVSLALSLVIFVPPLPPSLWREGVRLFLEREMQRERGR